MTLTNKAFGAAVALAGAFALASPATAWTHHHRAQQTSEEQQETAQLNEQQLTNPGTTQAPDMNSTRDNNRATPASDMQAPASGNNDTNQNSDQSTSNGEQPH